MSPKLKTYQICFSKRYNKLNPLQLRFTTVRWLDSMYKLGQIYEIFYVVPGFHRKIHLGSARLMRMDVKRINELGSVFTRMDADCDYPEFVELLRGWYENKTDPPWMGDHSEIQVLYLERIFHVKEDTIQDQISAAYQIQKTLEAPAC